MTSKYNCPECGAAVNAWADLDATLTFQINKHGKLVKREIKNANQTDGRCGVDVLNVIGSSMVIATIQNTPILKS